MWTPVVKPEDIGNLNYRDVKIYHLPLSNEYHVGSMPEPDQRGTYGTLQMAKKVAQGVIKHNLKWNPHPKKNQSWEDECCEILDRDKPKTERELKIYNNHWNKKIRGET